MRKALVVGINDYPSSPLACCVNDANEVAKRLERNEDNSVNFSVEKHLNVATKGELRRMIRECFQGNADTSLFYFSGHGHIDDAGGYIVSPDYSSDDWGVSMQDILSFVNSSSGCRNKIVILDCCHAGFMGSISSIGHSATLIEDGVTILTASMSNEPAVEKSGHGLFTTLLISALDGGAADVMGQITPSGIYSYIDKALGPWAQRPVFKTNVTRFVPLRTVNPQVSLATLQKLTEYFPDSISALQLDPSFESTNTTDYQHKLLEPYADEQNTKTFSDLQLLESVGLVVPDGEPHMYYAAVNSKFCRLTPVGRHYWRLVKDNII